MEREVMPIRRMVEYLRTFPGPLIYVLADPREAENSADYFSEHGFNCRYINEDVGLESQQEIIRRFGEGEIDILVITPEYEESVWESGIDCEIFFDS